MSSEPSAEALPLLPRDEEGPVFAEPWQAQAFAMALHLHAEGYFTWPEWAERLAARIDAAGLEDDPANYYVHWLATLEELATARELASEDELTDRRAAWKQAADRTPHGQPIEL